MSNISEKASFMYDSEEEGEELFERGVNPSANPFGKRIDIVAREQLEIRACEDNAREGILSIPDYINGLKELVQKRINNGYVDKGFA